jgi:putative two-component system response regulator
VSETGPKAKILVVDDEKSIRVVLGDILVSQGYAVLQAGSGAEALRVIRKEAPDVILLDIRMPDMDGLEVTRRIKSEPSLMHIPIIIVTGMDDIRARIEALKLGADDFLVKPPHLAELSARVRSLVKVKAYNDHMLNHQKELEAEVAERTRQLKGTLKQLEQAHEKLRSSSLDTIYRLSRAAEYKDEDTSVHFQRMSHYAAAIARRLGVDGTTVETILYASPMHDVGKIGIPDKILLKPGKLSPGEWKIMKKHTLFGAKILEHSSSDFINLGEVIALTHHEKWDGTGYPNGHRGKDIPLVGRITALADVFDALTSKRPYKKAFSTEKAFRIIEEGRASHFDPGVVDAFFDIKGEILEIKKRYRDNRKSLFIDLAEKTF